MIVTANRGAYHITPNEHADRVLRLEAAHYRVRMRLDSEDPIHSKLSECLRQPYTLSGWTDVPDADVLRLSGNVIAQEWSNIDRRVGILELLHIKAPKNIKNGKPIR